MNNKQVIVRNLNKRSVFLLLTCCLVLLIARFGTAQLPDDPAYTQEHPKKEKGDPLKRITRFIRPSERPHLPGEPPVAPLTFREQTRFYAQQTYGAESYILCSYPPVIAMTFPEDNYPKEWREGAGAYARNYGDVFATHTAAQTGKYLTAALVREDPRYFAANSTNTAVRTIHAIGFTLFDRSRDGGSMLAISNIAGAFAGGFVGRAYLPHGYNDNVHALQRTLGLLDGSLTVPILGTTTHNLIQEFTPELAALGRKLHLVRKPPMD